MAFVGATGATEIAAPVVVVDDVTELPPLTSKVIVSVSADQIAYKVKSAVWPCAYGKVITEPELVVDHPVNVYPARVGAVGADEIVAAVFVEPVLTEDPL